MSDTIVTNLPYFSFQTAETNLRWTDQHVFHGETLSSGLKFIQSHLAKPDPRKFTACKMDKKICWIAGRLVLNTLENFACTVVANVYKSIPDYFLQSRKRFDEKKFADGLNGAGSVFFFDEIKVELEFWTDRLGFYPLYIWKNEVHFIVSSNLDFISRVLLENGVKLEIDSITIAEFLATGTASHPHTYWKSVEQADAATKYKISFRDGVLSFSKNLYWTPGFLSGELYITNESQAVEVLTNALANSIARRTADQREKVGVMLSAGADSRLALMGVPHPNKVTSFTFYDEINPEVISAKKLAAIAKSKHVLYKRDVDYYFKHAREAVNQSSGTWSIDSAHYGAMGNLAHENGIDILLTGCYADYLLKGLAYNRINKKIFNRDIPLYSLDKFNYEWYQPFVGISEKYTPLVYERLRDGYSRHSIDGASKDQLLSLAEYHRLSPISREADSSGRFTLRCTTPHDFFMADTDVLNCAFQLHPNLKKDGIIFGKAVARITGGESNKVWNNNYHAPVNASGGLRVALYIFDSFRRKILRDSGKMPFEVDSQSIGTFGSWPHFPKAILLSETLRLWSLRKDPLIEEFILEILGKNYKNFTIMKWSENSFLFLRYFTLYLWLEKNKSFLK